MVIFFNFHIKIKNISIFKLFLNIDNFFNFEHITTPIFQYFLINFTDFYE
jgi:hypothetical protein